MRERPRMRDCWQVLLARTVEMDLMVSHERRQLSDTLQLLGLIPRARILSIR